MSHQWGDSWEYWEDLGKAILRAEQLAKESGLSYAGMKEKFGEFRWYIDQSEYFDATAYRKVYETLIAEYPQITDELLNASDWGQEYLVGLVDPETCKHKHWWSRTDGGSWCGVCFKKLKKEK